MKFASFFASGLCLDAKHPDLRSDVSPRLCLSGSTVALTCWIDSSLFYFSSGVLLASDAPSGTQAITQAPSTVSYLPVLAIRYIHWGLNAALCTCTSWKTIILLGLCFWIGILNSLSILWCMQSLKSGASCILIRLEAIGAVRLWALPNKSGQQEALAQWTGCWSHSLRSPVLFAVPLSRCSLRQAIRYS